MPCGLGSVNVTKKDNERRERERRAQLLAFWRERPIEKRTGNDVAIFYRWLEENRPELLRRGSGDPYQHLQADLSSHICEMRR